jgi:cytochrome c
VDAQAADGLRFGSASNPSKNISEDIMKPILQTLLSAALALLIAMVLVWPGAGTAQEASKPPRGIHLQNPKLDPELVRKTKEETDKVIQRGQMLWKDRQLGTNGQNCNMCHPDGSATHPETFPKFKQQFGRVATVQEFINWCIVAAMRGDSHEIGSDVLTALEAYQAYASRGQIMEIGVPGP